MQLRYETELVRGFPGMPYSSHLSADILTGINDDPLAKQVVEFAVTAEASAGDLTIQNKLISATGADEDAVAAALAAAINAEPLVNGSVIAEAATDTVTVTARVGGIGFQFADGTDTTATETQENAKAAAIPFGRAVQLVGESDDGSFLVKLLSENAPADVLGISMYTATTEKGRATGVGETIAAEYPGGHELNVGREGRFYVEVEADVSVGDSVYVRHTADGALDKLGAFAGASGSGLVELPGCRWLQGARKGAAVLGVNLD